MAKYSWLGAGALSMGSGIWSMHFIGILAYDLGMPVSYDVLITVLSWAVAVMVCGFALSIGSREDVCASRRIVGGIIMGLGICAMHYTGMAATQMDAELHYDPALFALSVAIALTAASAALWLFFRLGSSTTNVRFVYKICAALVMGIAVVGMHYTGMEAAYYVLEPGATHGVAAAADNHWLATSVGLISLIILGVTLLTIFFDHKLGVQTEFGKRMEMIVDARTTELFREKERAEVTLDCIADGVITTDAEGRVEHLNPVAQAFTGWKKEEAKGRLLDEVFNVVNGTTREPAGNLATAVLREGRPLNVSAHTILVARDGREYAIDQSASPILNRHRQALGAVLVFRDVSTKRESTRQRSRLASRDALTGLINRHEFETRLHHALSTALGAGHEHAIIYFDLDRFKFINDTGGPAAGDEVMRQLTRVIGKMVRATDAFARLGSDEFAILVEKCPLSMAKQIAEKMRKLVEQFSLFWEGRTFTLSVSIGLVPIAANSGGLTQVLTAADTACCLAKEKGRNNIQVYEDHNAGLAKGNSELAWVKRIHQALADNRFVFYRQPIEPLNDEGQAAGEHFEILLRFRDEQERLLPPMSFIPVAERYGMMPAIDRWVVSNALRMLANDRALLSTLRTCAINLSGQSLGDEDFHAFVEEQFDQTGVDPKFICFEITETAAISNLNKAVQFIKTLRARGCSFSLDDFGSGLSSFVYLKNLAVDYIKIDGAFIKNMLDSNTDSAIVRSICDIGRALGIKTIAEFVESRLVAEKLRELGVDFVQGYGIGQPVFLSEYVPPFPAEDVVRKQAGAAG